MTPSDLDILARTLYGEARGEPFAGMVAVAHVVLNRVAARHRGEHRIAGAATEPWQFSCWNVNDPNVRRLEAVSLNDPIFRRCYRAALEAVEQHEEGSDPTRGSLHYCTLEATPGWIEGKRPVAVIGDHRFFNNID